MTDKAVYFLGIDGGGTSCRARLINEAGQVIGEGRGGSSNVTLGAETVKTNIMKAVDAAFSAAKLGILAMTQTYACFGLAGTEAETHLNALKIARFPFRALDIVNDSVIACAGAHEGDGAILIVGTGSQGLLMKEGALYRAGGWGFALSDDASGANMGRASARLAMLAYDNIVPPSPFTEAVIARFGSPSAMMEWALTAIPRDWATLAPLAQEFAAKGDVNALTVQEASVKELTMLLERLKALGAKRIALVGGLAAYYTQLVPQHLKPLMVKPLGDAMDGALRLARKLRAEP